MYDGKIFKVFLLRSGITIYWKSYLIEQGKMYKKIDVNFLTWELEKKKEN